MRHYLYARLRAEGVALVRVDGLESRRERGEQVWCRAKTRKQHQCAILGEPIPKGARAWRPMTNLGNRMDRISQDGMAVLVGRLKA